MIRDGSAGPIPEPRTIYRSPIITHRSLVRHGPARMTEQRVEKSAQLELRIDIEADVGENAAATEIYRDCEIVLL